MKRAHFNELFISRFSTFGKRVGERAGECGVVHFSTQFFILDKAKALPIRIGSQTAWQVIRLDFTDRQQRQNDSKKITNYTVGVISCCYGKIY